MLHIVNGDSVISSFRQVRFPGAYLSWADALHDGPVPQTTSLEELSEVRARALADFGSGDYQNIRADFAQRDRTLQDFRKHEEVVLWFEHDLFDQLQLLQLLDWFAAHDAAKTRLSLIQINSYPGVQPFYGLGQLSGAQLVKLFPARQTLTPEQLSDGREVWHAFRRSSPDDLLAFSEQDFTDMPFLRIALVRFLQEYPWTTDGLSRTQRQILLAVQAGAHTRQEIYLGSRAFEDCPWGDSSVYLRLDSLVAGPNPALQKGPDQSYTFTASGRQLLDGKADWVKLSGGLDMWLGGVHLDGAEAAWRWDQTKQALLAG